MKPHFPQRFLTQAEILIPNCCSALESSSVCAARMKLRRPHPISCQAHSTCTQRAAQLGLTQTCCGAGGTAGVSTRGMWSLHLSSSGTNTSGQTGSDPEAKTGRPSHPAAASSSCQIQSGYDAADGQTGQKKGQKDVRLSRTPSLSLVQPQRLTATNHQVSVHVQEIPLQKVTMTKMDVWN